MASARQDGDDPKPGFEVVPKREPPRPSGSSSVPPAKASGKTRKKDPMIGRVIAGRFRIQSLIARGGMGKVYRGVQEPLGRPCAVKVLNPKYDGEDDPEFQRRFFLEASTASKLTHANTVTIFDYGRDEEAYYIAMEYVAGRTLFRALRDDGPLEESRVAHIVFEVGRSLREAHAIGVIHRDMKPANIVLLESETEGDQIRVLDFGLVKHVEPDEAEDLTQQGLFMGSPKYMAPEQILGHPVSPATDIYALGVVAYELLTGKVPFDRGSSVKTLMAHCNDPAVPVDRANPQVAISPEMTAIVMRCLEKEAHHRYATIDELNRDLARVTGGGPIVESYLRAKKVSVPPDMGVSGAHGPNDQRQFTRSDPDEDTQPTTKGSIPAPPAVAPVPGDDSGAHVGQWPSKTPEPMSQALLGHEGLTPPRSNRWPAVAGVLVGLVLLGGIALLAGDGDPTADAPPSSTDDVTTPASPAPAAVRVVRLTSTPPGAKVMEGDEVLCGATPCEVSWRGDEAEQVHRLTFSKDGHTPREVALPLAAEALEGQLELLPVKPRAVPPGPLPRGKTKPAPRPTPKPGKTLSGYKDSPY